MKEGSNKNKKTKSNEIKLGKQQGKINSNIKLITWKKKSIKSINFRNHDKDKRWQIITSGLKLGSYYKNLQTLKDTRKNHKLT